MRHVDHEGGADLVGDLAHRREVHAARVGGVAAHEDERPELPGLLPDGVVVDEPGDRVGAVTALVEHLAGDVGPEAVREVAAGVEAHAQQTLGAEAAAQVLPVLLRQVVDGPGAQLGQAGGLDAVRQDRPVADEVGVDARVGLDVGVVGAEELLGVPGRDGLDRVDVAAAGVEAVPDGALGILVGEPRAHGEQRRERGVVLRRDELQRVALIGQLLADGLGDGGLGGLDDLEHGLVGDARLLHDVGSGHWDSSGGGSVRCARRIRSPGPAPEMLSEPQI